jgi:DNA polymerase elongation subunit (family B)
MVSWNMSYETRVNGPVNGPLPPGMCRSPKTGICFDTETLGIIPEAMEYFLAKRKEMNALRASLPPGTPEAHDAERWTNGYKVAPNSMYGGQGSPGSRFHNRSVAESIAQTGAWLAEKTEVALNERAGRRVVFYIDTDGLWLHSDRPWVEDAVKWLNEVFYPKLLADCGCKKNIVKIAYEKEFERLVMVKAKNYCGVYKHFKGTAAVEGSKPEIKGLAYKRGDQTRFTRNFQAEIIDLLMGGMKISPTPGPTEDIALFEEAVGRWRTLILEGELAIEDVQTVKGLSQKLEDYAERKSTKGNVVASPPHVRVARRLKSRGHYVGPGTKIAYVVTDADAKPQGVIPAMDYAGECDRRHLWGDVVWAPTQRLLESAFPSHDWKKFNSPKKQRGQKLVASEGVALSEGETGSLF